MVARGLEKKGKSVYWVQSCSFARWKSYRDGCWQWPHNNMNILNATECKLKMIKMVNFVWYFTTIRKKLVGEPALLANKNYYKTLKYWYWYKDRPKEHRNRRERPERDPHIPEHLISDKGSSTQKWGKKIVFNKWCWVSGTYWYL